MERLTIAFIGFGKSMTRYHYPFVRLRENIRVKLVYAPRWREERNAEYPELTVVKDLDTIWNDPEIEAVVLCTPASTHEELARTALLHRKHVLVEKPFATSVAGAKALLDLARERGLICMPYQNRRYDADFLAVQDALNSGKIGTLVEVISHMDLYRPECGPAGEGTHYYDGALYGLGVHTIDQLVSLFGKPNQVLANVRSIRYPGNPDDYFDLSLFYDGFKCEVKTSHNVLTPFPRFTIIGTKGSYIKPVIDRQEYSLKAGVMPGDTRFADEPESDYGILTIGDSVGVVSTEVKASPRGDYGRIYDDFYEAIVNGADKEVSDEQALIVMEILEKGIQALQNGPILFEVKGLL